MYKQAALVTIVGIFTFLAINAFNTIHKTKGFIRSESPGHAGSSENDTIIPIIPANAQGYKGTTVSKNAGLVNFNSATDNDYYRTDTVNRHAFLYLETQVGEFINDNAKRVPLNLSIVIDRSGSMSGDKIKHARDAAAYVIDQLKTEDIVSIIIYDDKVELLQAAVPATDKEALKRKIKGIFPGGSTNLWGGTEKGYEQVKTNYKPNYVNRVLLLSDGLANAGITDQKVITHKVQAFKDQEGITLSTFGIGLDYNETLMTDMAETGSGNYYFIAAPDKLAGIFNKELNGLLNVAAQNTALKVLLPEGVSIEKVYNYKYSIQGNELVFSLRDLFSLENKGILLYCKLNNDLSGDLKFISTLSFTNVVDKQQVVLVNENIIKPMPGMDIYVTHFNEKVIQQAILGHANENMERAMTETDRGNYERARIINVANGQFLKSNAAYVSKSVELQRMDSATARYSVEMKDAEDKSELQMKLMQKSSKENNYKIRTKKQ